MTKVHVLQVNDEQKNINDLNDAIKAGHTDPEGWQMPKTAAPGDLVVWYAARRHPLGQHFIALGRVEEKPSKVRQGFGPYRGQVAGIRKIEPVDAKKVRKESRVYGGHEGPQTVPDEKAVAFLLSLGLLD